MSEAGPGGQAAPAPFYVVFDVDVRDTLRYAEYMAHVLPQIEAAGGKYLARGGPHTVYEGERMKGASSPAGAGLAYCPGGLPCRHENRIPYGRERRSGREGQGGHLLYRHPVP